MVYSISMSISVSGLTSQQLFLGVWEWLPMTQNMPMNSIYCLKTILYSHGDEWLLNCWWEYVEKMHFGKVISI